MSLGIWSRVRCRPYVWGRIIRRRSRWGMCGCCWRLMRIWWLIYPSLINSTGISLSQRKKMRMRFWGSSSCWKWNRSRRLLMMRRRKKLLNRGRKRRKLWDWGRLRGAVVWVIAGAFSAVAALRTTTNCTRSGINIRVVCRFSAGGIFTVSRVVGNSWHRIVCGWIWEGRRSWCLRGWYCWIIYSFWRCLVSLLRFCVGWAISRASALTEKQTFR